MSPWVVPGYDVQELLGFGTSGEVWRARERSSGALVALRRIAGGDREAVATVLAQATVVRSLPTAHVLRLRTTTRAGRDDVLVLDHAAGGSLASLLLRRGRLEPGEVVTAVAPLADALGQAHAQGLAHGRVRVSSVLLTEAGMPLLDGLGLSCLYDAEDTCDAPGGPGPAADVWALGALAHQLLTGEAPGTAGLHALAPRAPLPLVRAVEAALGADPADRPAAGDLAAALLAACPALPLEGTAAVAPPLPVPLPVRRPVPRSAPPRVSLLVAGGLLIASVVGAGWVWGARTADRPALVAAPTVDLSPDWGAVLGGLDRARAEAFARADAARLAGVYGAAGPLLTADQRAITALVRLRRTAVGVEHEVRGVTPVRVGTDSVTLRVVESLRGYEVVDGVGRVVGRHPPGTLVTHEVVLVRLPRGWRVSRVSLVG